MKPGLPSSVTLQPAQGETEKPCGVDFILRCYVAKNAEDKIEKRNSVRLAIKKITHAPIEHTQRVSPSCKISKIFNVHDPLVCGWVEELHVYVHVASLVPRLP